MHLNAHVNMFEGIFIHLGLAQPLQPSKLHRISLRYLKLLSICCTVEENTFQSFSIDLHFGLECTLHVNQFVQHCH